MIDANRTLTLRLSTNRPPSKGRSNRNPASIFGVALIIGVLLVLWNLSPSSAYAQRGRSGVEADSSRSDSVARMLFGSPNSERSVHDKLLRSIVTVGVGSYWQFTDLARYEPVIQPTAGIDLYAAPDGGVGFLFGGHFGFKPYFCSGIDIGVRLPLKSSNPSEHRFFLDGSVLFFDEGIEPQAFQTGARLVLAHSWEGRPISEELRLAFEFRGTRRVDTLSPLKPLFWIGLEGGISFSLIGEVKQLSRKDSIRAALRYITSDAELSEFDGLKQREEIDAWLADFWRKREKSVGGAGSDLENEFYQRIRIANKQFSRVRRLGIETDPGRVMIIYGMPSSTVTGASTVDPTVEYMIWPFHQRIRGASEAVFLFRRISGGDWREEYSNVQGEGATRLPGDLPINIQETLPSFLR